MTALSRDAAPQAHISNITIEPAPSAWRSALQARATSHASAFPSNMPSIVSFRKQLGLPDSGIVIMSGHQAEFWHPGILSKYFALDAARSAFNAAAAWIVVDQDTNWPGDIRYPTQARADASRLAAATWSFLPPKGRELQWSHQTPTGLLPSSAPAPMHDSPRAESAPALASVRSGLDRIRASLLAHAKTPSLAHQITRATQDMLRPVAEPPVTLYATDLGKTDLFRWLIDRMLEDPARCVQAYDRAVRDHPEAGVRTLDPLEGRLGYASAMLPLWRLTSSYDATSGTRVPANADDVRGNPSGPFAPRALLLTALLRLGACDLFIHGLGGGVYDRITDQWIREWLNIPLAPTAVVTASMYLPLTDEPERAGQLIRSQWLAHHARHDPALLGDADAARAKALLLDEILAERSLGNHPHSQYRAMHQLLEQVRARHAAKLAELQDAADQARASVASAQIAADRTWAFPLFDDPDLQLLKTRIREEFGLAPA